MKPLYTASLALAVLLAPMATIARAEISAEQVRESIRKGVAYLKNQQRRDGSWPDYQGHPVGVTALCTLALLNCGVEPNDPAIRSALGYLRKQEPKQTYDVSLQTMVFCEAEPTKDLLLIRRNVEYLEKIQITNGSTRGSWSYSTPSGGDNSNSQFALLALHEAERVGVTVQARTWNIARSYWERYQNVDGSWGYKDGDRSPTGSMTCAGIASLVITSGKGSLATNARVTGEQIECCLEAQDTNDRIERGLEWLGRVFSVARNPGDSRQYWVLYYLYAMERVGRMTAHRFIGEHDWYREGADWLVRHQEQLSGFWRGAGPVENIEVIGTSFALLFLAKGRRPVLMAKLKHSLGDDWNAHRSDAANLTAYVESRWKQNMTWQVIDIRTASVEDLRQAPVLYLCGSLNPLPQGADARKALARKLRDYLDRGGFLLAEAYGKGGDFDRGFRGLIEEMFPEPEYRLRLLEMEHPIWRTEEVVPPQFIRPLWGVDFGCRTSVVYAPPDPPGSPRPSLSCLWELARPGHGERYPAAVQAQIDAAESIGVNILAYATNRELQGKEEFLRGPGESASRDKIDRGRLAVAKLRHPGGCNAAPRALVNLLETVAEQKGIRTEPRAQLIGILDNVLFDYPLVFMHGRNSFRLTDAERRRLQLYIERGGMLFADSICGSRPFTESFRSEMAAIFPNHPLEPIPANDPLLTTDYGGFDLSTVLRRDPPADSGDGPLKPVLRRVPPELEGIRIDDRWVVIFSKYDVSCALEKHDSPDCRGYSREDAARIGLNVILYALQE